MPCRLRLEIPGLSSVGIGIVPALPMLSESGEVVDYAKVNSVKVVRTVSPDPQLIFQ